MNKLCVWHGTWLCYQESGTGLLKTGHSCLILLTLIL
ncbi:hypothetical protein ABIB60_001664 [Hymenobacter sp. UYP22]